MIVTRRQATATDREFARAVHHRAYREIIERQYGPWDETAQDKSFDGAWSRADHEIVLCDAVPCGYCRVEDRRDDIYVHELVIDPDYQNLGIGTRVLQGVFDDSRLRGVPVCLRTQTLNRAAALYRRLGFRETGRTDIHILMEWRELQG